MIRVKLLVFFIPLKLLVAVARHNLKWVKCKLFNFALKGK